MTALRKETQNFRTRKKQEIEAARRTAAFFLACGVDLAAALAMRDEARRRLCRKLARLVERERLRGMCRHWSYDLNRHIALSQALRQLEASGETV